MPPMNSAPSLIDDPRLFLAFFVCGWCAVSYSLSFLGGWFALGMRFRRTSAVPLGKSFWFASLSMRKWLIPVSYRNCIFATVCAQGVGLSVFPVFRLGHAKLFIPWSAVADCSEKTFLIWTRTVLQIN